MRKYLELFKDGFDATIAEKIKPENYPYVGYSPSEGFTFTEVPEPVAGPADNEIWYTTVDGNIFDIDSAIQNAESILSVSYTGPSIISNEFDSNKKVYIVTFDKEMTRLGLTPISDYNYVFNGPILFDPQNFETAIPFISSIHLPQSVLEINYYGYFYTAATEITIPNNVTNIGGSAIMQNEELTKLNIPNTVTNISTYAIAANPKLDCIEFCGTMNEWKNINKGTPWIVTCPLATTVHCTDGDIAI